MMVVSAMLFVLPVKRTVQVVCCVVLCCVVLFSSICFFGSDEKLFFVDRKLKKVVYVSVEIAGASFTENEREARKR